MNQAGHAIRHPRKKVIFVVKIIWDNVILMVPYGKVTVSPSDFRN